MLSPNCHYFLIKLACTTDVQRFLIINFGNEIFSTLVLMHCFLTTNSNNRCAINFRKTSPIPHSYSHIHIHTLVHMCSMRLLQFFMVNFLANISQTLSLPSDSCDCVIFITFLSYPLSAIPFVHWFSHILFTFRFSFNISI